jgi:hypothetical protein
VVKREDWADSLALGGKSAFEDKAEINPKRSEGHLEKIALPSAVCESFA